ncbi:CoA-binding protein, partial [Corynebacterium sp.]|uniref:CoA-binding protein n=1 Tax=Corynebacterium sp. TaxID=1720 RepID=UPI0026E03B6E
MAVLLDDASRIIVQGITGREGRLHTERMLAAGARVVGGTNPKKAGETLEISDAELPVFATVAQAREEVDANVSVVFVPAPFVKDAVLEAIEASMPLIVVITEGVPVQDTAEMLARASTSSRIVGPNCPGIITPGASLAGIIPGSITGSGPVGLISKSGTLTYQMMNELSDVGISTAIGIGGDPLIGTDFIDALALFEADADTEAIVMIGEIGGDAEER